ncbi:radical SAM protein, partial [Bacteroidales bacterium OttesenSCG-928-M06]|nr:radical SAM protein [Bacteroidales bacterium OttesenSCG-928-M06]
IEPNLLTDEIIEFVSGSQRFAPHFHIPLQSGSDEVLKLMKRKYDTALFRSKIEKIKQYMPNAFIGIDVIVGVRGETEAYFEDAKRFLDSLPFSQLHVFTYSERPGTMALKIDYVVDPKEKQKRSKTLLEMSDVKNKQFYLSQSHTPHKVLFEHTRKGSKMYGFTENYVKVEAEYNSEWVNRVKEVMLGDFNAEQTALLIHSI